MSLKIPLKSIFLLLIVIISKSSLGQCGQQIKTIYGKVISTDFLDNSSSGKNFLDHGNVFYYGIFHIEVETYNSDTIFLGIVYLLRNDKSEISKFNLLKDSTYIFAVSDFSPCQSDFPFIKGCRIKKKDAGCYYFPEKGQIIKEPYNLISRVVEVNVLYNDLWEKLQKEFKNKKS